VRCNKLESNVFNFTSSIQEKILALIWTDSTYFRLYAECVKPKYFQKAIHIDLCRILLGYYEKYNCPPTKDAFIQEVYVMCDKNSTKAKLQNEYLDCIDRMSSMDFNDYDFLKDKIIEFGKKQAMIEAIMESAEIIEKNSSDSYHRVSEIIQKAQMVGEDSLDLGINYWDKYDERIRNYSVAEDVIERFPTGMGELDRVLNGGVGRTEMIVILAPPGRGKTTCMINIGASGLRNGLNVAHFSFENNELQVVRNYDQRVLNRSYEYMQEEPEKSIEALGRVRKYSNGGQLFVKKYPTKGATVDNMKMYIRRLELIYSVKIDMVIVDYGAIIKPKSNFSDKRNIIEGNYEDLRALADELNVAMVTGAQGTRSSLSKKVVTIEDLAECFAIANTADVILALCQTIREKKDGKIRGFLAKVRDSADSILLMGDINYETKRINYTSDITDTLVEEESDEEDDDDDYKSKYKGKKKSKKKPTEEDEYENS
jgi:replicative DNA helicase